MNYFTFTLYDGIVKVFTFFIFLSFPNARPQIVCGFCYFLYYAPLFGKCYPKRGRFYDPVLPAHTDPVQPADPCDSAHGQAADRANGTHRICCNHAGGKFGLHSHAGRDQLMRIEEMLGDQAVYLGRKFKYAR